MHIVTAHAAGPVLLSQYGTGEEWDRLGLELLSNGEPSLALAAFSEAQALTPASLSFALHVVEAACACGQTAAALDRADAACDRDPLDPVAPVMRGVLLDRLGQREAAIDALMVAYALAPDSAAAAMFLGGLLARANRLKEAEQALAAAAELDPDNAMVQNDRAAVLIRLHRHADARRLLLDVGDAAGPPGAVSSKAAIYAMTADGKINTLRQGTNGFWCLPDDPSRLIRAL